MVVALPAMTSRHSHRAAQTASLARSLSLALALLWAPTAAQAAPPAGDRAFALSPTELLALDAGAHPADIDVQVILDDEHIAIDEEGRFTTTRRLLYRVLTQKGAEDWASTGATYHPWHQDKPTWRVRVVTPDAKVHTLNPATLVDSAASQQQGAIYSDLRRISGPLPAVRPGTVVEEQITTREHRSYFAAGRVTRRVVAPGAFTHAQRVVVSAPSKLPVRYRLRGAKGKPKRSTRDGRTTLTFLYRDLKPLRRWPGTSGPDVAPVPIIEVATGKSWNTIARAYAAAVDAQVATFDAATLAAAVVEAGDSRQQQVDKLLAYVHAQVRYTGLELGERALLPAAPGDTLGRHFGDCKDKATLLVALLRARGIAAHVALLDAGNGLDVPQKLPGMGLFDHAIVYLPGKRPDVRAQWIDATADSYPAGVLPSGDRARRALVAAPDTRKLIATDALSAADNTYREEVHVQFTDSAPARVVETTTGTGAIGGYLRSAYDDTQTTLDSRFSKYVEQRFDGKLAGFKTEFVRDVSQPVKLQITVEKAKRYTSFDDGGFGTAPAHNLYNYIPELLQKDGEKDAERKAREKRRSDEKDPRFRYPPKVPVYVEPHTYELVYHLPVPADFRWQSVPEPLSMSAAGIHLWRKVDLAPGDRELTITFGLRNDTALKPVAKIPEIQRMLNDFVGRSEGSPRFVHQGGWAIEQGQVEAGLAAYRQAVAQAPDDVHRGSRYAQALVKLGFGIEGHAVAAALVKRHPKSAHAHWTLGYVSLFDGMGRDSYPGADFATAEKHLRRALALDPEDKMHFAGLRALLMLRPDEGRLFSEARRREVLSLLERQKAGFGDSALDTEILQQRFALGEYDAVLREITSAPDTQVSRTLWVASVYMTRGLAAADRKAAELAGGDGASLVQAASGLLATLGLTREAHELGTKSRAMRGKRGAEDREKLYGGLMRAASCRDAMTPAARALHDYLMTFVDTPEGKDGIAQVTKRKWAAHVDADAVRAALSRVPVPWSDEGQQRVVRMYLMGPGLACNLQWSSDESHGAIRVRLHTLGTPAERDSLTFYLRRRGKRFSVVGAQDGHNLGSLGRLAMTALRQRRVPQARVWLEWATDIHSRLAPAQDRYGVLHAARTLTPASLAEADARALWPLAATLSNWRGMGAPEERAFRAALKRADRAALKRAKGAGGDAAADPRRHALTFGLASALGWQGKYAEQATLLESLSKAMPRDRNLRAAFVRTLYKAHDYDRAGAELTAAVAAFPDLDELQRDLQMYIRCGKGECAAVLQEAQARQARGEAKSGELNNVSWAALFHPVDMDVAVELASASVEADRRVNNLHTLATLQVEVGQLDEAHRNLAQAIEGGSSRRGAPHEWYTLGRLAEALGLRHSASHAFAQMEAPKRAAEYGSYRLYERRKQTKHAPARGHR